MCQVDVSAGDAKASKWVADTGSHVIGLPMGALERE